MNPMHHPELIDRLAAGYALGTLRGAARRRFETWARQQPKVRAAALVWQSRWAALAELQEQVPPPAAVWTRIDLLLRAEKQRQALQVARRPAPAARRAFWLDSLLLWRGAALAGLAAAVLVLVNGRHLREELEGQVAALESRLQVALQFSHVAVLSDARSAATMLVTFDPAHRTLVLQRVGGYEESGDKSLQLWALPPGAAPRSLGVLGRDKLLRLTAAEADVRGVPTLAISLEPLGGVPSERGPTGPVLFTGALIQRLL